MSIGVIELPPRSLPPLGYQPFSSQPSLVQIANIANSPPAPSATPSIYGSTRLVAEVSMNETAYVAIGTTPLVMIPAPGANKFVFVRQIMCRLSKSNQWTNSGTTIRAQYTGQVQSLGAPSTAFLVGAGGGQQTNLVDGVAQTLTGGAINQSVEIFATSVPNPGVQTGTVYVAIEYEIFNAGF